MGLAHTQIEGIKGPGITALTMRWADQNKPKIDRSEEVSGKADCATSAGCMAQGLSADPLRPIGGALPGAAGGQPGAGGWWPPKPAESRGGRAAAPAVMPRS